MDVLILRLEGPMLSFGAPIVDSRGVIQQHPPLSMLTGLIGNALGYRHGDFERLQRLQERIRYAVRCDRSGERFIDYQSVDLGQEHLQKTGWTTRGEREDRRGGRKSKGTHIRHREYLANGCYTVALTLQPVDESPSLESVEEALRHPERPLFIGRKTCLPSSPLLSGRMSAPDVLAALRRWPAVERSDAGRLEAWWPAELSDDEEASRNFTVTDQRDWANQIHTGERRLRHGRIDVRGGADE
jgi:CRISPR system Cascade subunit CasD